MNDETIEHMQGQLLALSNVLTAIISSLPPLIAAKAALYLQIEEESQKKQDANEGADDAVTRARSGINEAYIETLQSVSDNG